MLFWYNLGIRIYYWLIRFYAIFNTKAKKWVEGRQDLFITLQQQISKKEPLIWFHVASLGEFEQGRPIIDALKKSHPSYKILLSFFSPSGYEVRKKYPNADYITYLPLDTKENAQQFIDIVQPDLVVFVKYEFWYHFLQTLKERKIKTILVSAVFRPQQVFFKSYGGLFRKMLHCFSPIFVQTADSANLLQKVGIKNVQTAGDTRIDRVLNIAKEAKDFPIIANFCASNSILILGSSWPEDEKVAASFIHDPSFKHWKTIIAPHEINEDHLQKIEKLLQVPSIRYSQAVSRQSTHYQVLIIDNIGMLSSLYRYGKVAFIGGGFGSGIHNTLEPAAFNLPILFGPKYQKFEEANELVNKKGAFVLNTKSDIFSTIQLLENESKYQETSQKVQEYMQKNKGATSIILREITTFLPSATQS